MSNKKFFRFNNENNNNAVDLKKFEIILKVDSTSSTSKPEYSFKTNYPGYENRNDIKASVDPDTNILSISMDLLDDFYPISSIFWGKDYSKYTCSGISEQSKINITTDNNKLPFVIKDNVLKIVVPLDNVVKDFGASSLNTAINCKGIFNFAKLVILYTTENTPSNRMVDIEGGVNNKTKELFVNDNKYIGIC